MHAYDDGAVRFAIWVGPGRDPQVAYLDARQLVIASSESGIAGRQLHGSGVSHNVLGGERRGQVDPAVLHRIAHTAVDRDGAPSFDLLEPCHVERAPGGLCRLAEPEPRPGTEADPIGSLALEADFTVQWIVWDDPLRQGVLRRAVYADDRFLMEAALGPDGDIRAWPSRGLAPVGLEHLAPAALELARIEARIARIR